MISARFLLLFLFLILLKTVSGQENIYKNEIGIQSDNDAYLATKQDRYYTNGLFFYFRTALNPNKKQDTSKIIKKIWSISAGQKMYNPYTGKIEFTSQIDRPFAAYLYGGTSLQWHYKNEDFLKLEVQGGILGPSAKGKESQEFYHKIFGFYKISGWQYQIKDEASVNFILNYQKLIQRSANLKTDFSLPLEARLGNTFNGAKAGILFRTGDLNPFHQSAAANSTVSTYSLKTLSNKEFYFFLKPSLDYVIYDATISGGLFGKNKEFKKFEPVPFVFSQELGVVFSQKRWTSSFKLLFKTKEVKNANKTHQYGAFELFYRFN
jgi:lipid A 3-O-deacylase